MKALETRRRESSAKAQVVVRFSLDVSETGFGPKKEALSILAGDIENLALDAEYVRVEIAGYFHLALRNLHAKTVVFDGRRALGWIEEQPRSSPTLPSRMRACR